MNQEKVTDMIIRDQSRTDTEKVERLITQYSQSTEERLNSISQGQRRQNEAMTVILSEMSTARSEVQYSAGQILNMRDTMAVIHDTVVPTASHVDALLAEVSDVSIRLRRLVRLLLLLSDVNIDLGRKRDSTTNLPAAFPLPTLERNPQN